MSRIPVSWRVQAFGLDASALRATRRNPSQLLPEAHRLKQASGLKRLVEGAHRCLMGEAIGVTHNLVHRRRGRGVHRVNPDLSDHELIRVKQRRSRNYRQLRGAP